MPLANETRARPAIRLRQSERASGGDENERKYARDDVRLRSREPVRAVVARRLLKPFIHSRDVALNAITVRQRFTYVCFRNDFRTRASTESTRQ